MRPPPCGSASLSVGWRYREVVKNLRRALLGAVVLALVAASSAAAFTPTNQYYGKQWYLDQDRAFDFWALPPQLQSVKVAIVDSGVDCSLPDFQGQIAGAKSFVGGKACTDTQGHGTIVAGEIAGELNQAGVVGLAYSSQLLVAKVVAPDGTIPLAAEADGIRWAVDSGARVINLSFGAVRDPANPNLDTFSRLEAQAIAYAVSKGVTVVAAVGNSDEAYATPWPYASWPAALPHVIGVAALSRSGNVPMFSDRDPTFVDLAAPGVDIFSTFPKTLTDNQAGCTPQGYTDCASGDYRRPEGTSFAAPQVSAAAAVLLGMDPLLTSSQVSALLERNADDVDAATGCSGCPVGRDKYSGWGSLDVKGAVAALSSGTALPATDRFEPNDRVSEAHALFGRKPSVAATLDYWDDPVDVYRVRLARGERLNALLRARWAGAAVALTLWHGNTVARTAHPGKSQRFSFRARKAGKYYVELRNTSPGAGRYLLRLSKSSIKRY
jgi:subtilisin family serine protease